MKEEKNISKSIYILKDLVASFKKMTETFTFDPQSCIFRLLKLGHFCGPRGSCGDP